MTRQTDVSSDPSSQADVFIVVRDQLEYVQVCLESVFRHTTSFVNVFLWDNASDAATRDYLRDVAATHARVALIRSEENIGSIIPNNRMVALGRAPYIILLSPNTVVTPSWETDLIAHLAEHPNTAEVGYSGGVLGEDGRLRGQATGDQIDYVEGWCACLRRSVYDELGLFDDEHLQLAYGEDVDLSLRIVASGYDVHALAEERVLHFAGQARRSVFGDHGASLTSEANHAYLRQRWSEYFASGRVLAKPGRLLSDNHGSCANPNSPALQRRRVMRVAVPQLRAADPITALGADFAARGLVEHIRGCAAGRIEFQSIPADVSQSWSPAGVHSNSGGEVPADARTGQPTPSWNLLHDFRPSGDPRRHFLLRHIARGRFPVVLTHHALCYPAYLDSFFIPLLQAHTQPYDAVVCTSRAARGAFEHLLDLCAEHLAGSTGVGPRFAGQLPVIPLGVDTDLFRPRDVGDVRHQLRVPPNAFVLLWLGRLSAVTKADLLPLLRAYSLLRTRNPGCETLLVLVGTDADGYGRVLESHAAAMGLTDCLRVERTTPQTPIHLWYSAADAFVSPIDNLQESFGIAAVEAMASGIPQVVSDWSGHRDTVVSGETGFRVRTYWAACDDDAVAAWALWGDPAAAQALAAQSVACDLGALVESLEYLLRSPELRGTMGMAARARAVAEFGWPVVVERYIECWCALADEARRSEPPPPPSVVLPAFFRTFSGYASHPLTGAARVRIRPDANDLLVSEPRTDPNVGETSTVSVNDVETAIPTGLERLLTTLGGSRRELTLDDLEMMLVSDALPSAAVRRDILRGVKYGLFEVLM